MRACALTLLLVLSGASNAFAFTLNPATFISVTNEVISDLGAFVGLGADLHAYEGATPQGTVKGVDFGTSITAISLPGEVVKALTDLGIPSVPHYVPIPKINIQKTLPGRFLFGSEFIPEIKLGSNKLTVYGFDLQWTAIDRPRLPAIALRGQFNYSDLMFISAATYGGDVLATYKIAFVDTYGGAGYRFVNAKISVPAGIPAPPAVINLNPTLDAGHFFAGAIVRAGFARITTEADLTTRGVNTYGTKLSFFF